MEKIYIRDENDSPKRAESLAVENYVLMAQLEAKSQDEWSDEEHSFYLEAYAQVDFAYWALSKKNNPTLMNLEDLDTSLQKDDQGENSSKMNNSRNLVFAKKPIADDYSLSSRIFNQIISNIKIIALPILILLFTYNLFGSMWHLVSNILLIVMVFMIPLLVVIRLKSFQDDYILIKNLDKTFENVRSNIVGEKSINEICMEKWFSLKKCNPELF